MVGLEGKNARWAGPGSDPRPDHSRGMEEPESHAGRRQSPCHCVLVVEPAEEWLLVVLNAEPIVVEELAAAGRPPGPGMD